MGHAVEKIKNQQCQPMPAKYEKTAASIPFESKDEARALLDRIEQQTGIRYSFVVPIKGKHYRIAPSSVRQLSKTNR